MKPVRLFFKLMMLRRIFIMVSIIGGLVVKYVAGALDSFSMPTLSFPSVPVPRLPTVDVSPLVAFLSASWARLSMFAQNDLLLLSARTLLILSGLLLVIAVINRIRFRKKSGINHNIG